MAGVSILGVQLSGVNKSSTTTGSQCPLQLLAPFAQVKPLNEHGGDARDQVQLLKRHNVGELER
jgi:hypothetical protein